jgi:hypothetical protein
MATKLEMYEEIIETLEEYEIKSVNGRHLKRDNIFNLVFDCKYYNLPEEVQDTFFIEGALTYWDYEDFRALLIEYMEETYKHNLIDWDNTGFYGRSGGNYCVSFHAGTIADMVYYGFEGCDEQYYYGDFKEALKDVKTALKLMNEIKKFMVDYFTGALKAYEPEEE